MNIKHLAAGLILSSLAACVSPTPYQPASATGGPGYSDQQLASNRYRVTFEGNSATRRDQVENYLLLRSAEVTREAGYSWFAFDDRDTRASTTYMTSFYGAGGFWRPRFGHYWHSWAYGPFGEVGASVPLTRFDSYAEIILLTPSQAKDDPRALQASDVIAHLGPVAVPPKSAS